MPQLSNNQSIAFNEAETTLAETERQILTIYRASLKNVRSKLMKLAEKVGTFNQAELNKYDRLTKLQKQLTNEIKQITRGTYLEVSKANNQIVKNTYNRNWYGFEKEIGTQIAFNKINPELVTQIVQNPYPGVKLTDLIKTVGQREISRVMFELGQGLLQGDSLQGISRRIKDSLNVGYNDAIRIVRTEGLTAYSKSDIAANERAKDLGIDTVRRWDATLDGRTRIAHRQADGQPEDKKGDFIVGGVKFLAPRVVSPRNKAGSKQTASQRINCRCSTITEIADVPETMEARAEKQDKIIVNAKTGDEISINAITYDEWKKGKKV